MAMRYRNMLLPIYLGEEPPEEITKSIFLIGYSEANWYSEAIDYLKNTLEFDDAVVFIPKYQNNDTLYGVNERAWISRYIKEATAVVFWDEIKKEGSKGDLPFDFNGHIIKVESYRI